MDERKYSANAKKVMESAHAKAKEFKHNIIGTEHILLGLVIEPNGIAGKILREKDVTEEKIIEKIIEITGTGKDAAEYLTYSPRTKSVLEHARLYSLKFNKNYIDTEHLLLGLITQGESIAAVILNELGIMPSYIQEKIGHYYNNESIPEKNDEEKRKTKKAVEEFGKNLNFLAKEGKLDPVIGREEEIQRIIQILSRRTKNNPVLLGEPGVGKTAIAEGLAQAIVDGEVPEILRDKSVVTLDLAGMVAGSKYRGEFEERLKKVMKEIKEDGKYILFIDEMHTIIGAGAAEGAIDAANILKPALSRGELQAIGATTLDEYKKYIEKDAALERRFQPIMIEEPSVEDTVKILKGLRDKYEAHHKINITDEAVEAAAKLSHRYIADRFLPDKAIDLIDEASSKIRIKTFTIPAEFNELEEELEDIANKKQEAINRQDFEEAARLRDDEKNLSSELEKRKKDWEEENLKRRDAIGYEEIAELVSSWTGIPVKKMQEEESEKLLNLESILHKRVIGQDQAVTAVSRAIRRARVGLKDPKKPIGSFAFLGPTGVGKTELSKALAEVLFGNEDALIRIDMSEYMEKHTVSKIIGSPPGYVGYDEGGQLTEKVRKKPYSVILFDEIEKAHPDVFNILLQLLDDGRLTDSRGRTVDFKNTVIILTSNVGLSIIKKQGTLGFRVENPDEAEKNEYEKMKENIIEEMKKTFRPEFINRLDEIIVFHSLNKENIKEIVKVMVNNLRKRLSEIGINISVREEVIDFLASEGFDKEYGARPLQREIRKKIEDSLSEEILKGKISKDDNILISFSGGELKFEKAAKEKSEI